MDASMPRLAVENSMWRRVWNAMKDFRVSGTSLRDWLCGEADPTAVKAEAEKAMRLHLERMQGKAL